MNNENNKFEIKRCGDWRCNRNHDYLGKHTPHLEKPTEEDIKKIIETHGLMLLALYGVKEKSVKKDYSAVNVYTEELYQDLVKLAKVSKK